MHIYVGYEYRVYGVNFLTNHLNIFVSVRLT
jgi:hypothetical protein